MVVSFSIWFDLEITFEFASGLGCLGWGVQGWVRVGTCALRPSLSSVDYELGLKLMASEICSSAWHPRVLGYFVRSPRSAWIREAWEGDSMDLAHTQHGLAIIFQLTCTHSLDN
eukprot:211972-Amorphochlora_amoeboformis.AAC.2